MLWFQIQRLDNCLKKNINDPNVQNYLDNNTENYASGSAVSVNTGGRVCIRLLNTRIKLTKGGINEQHLKTLEEHILNHNYINTWAIASSAIVYEVMLEHRRRKG